MDKILTIKERILQYAESQHIKKTDLFKSMDISPSNFKGEGIKSEIGSGKIINFLTTFPNVSPDWLLFGRGGMLRPQVQNVNGHHNTATMNGDIHQSTGDNDTQRLDSLLEANRKLIDQHAELIRQQGELIEIIKSITKDTLQK